MRPRGDGYQGYQTVFIIQLGIKTVLNGQSGNMNVIILCTRKRQLFMKTESEGGGGEGGKNENKKKHLKNIGHGRRVTQTPPRALFGSVLHA